VLVVLEDEVHHPPVGRIAELLRYLFGQYFDLANGLRWVGTEFAEARHFGAVNEKHGPSPAAAPTRGTGLALHRLDQFLDGACAECGDICLFKFEDGRLFDVQLTTDALCRDDNGA